MRDDTRTLEEKIADRDAKLDALHAKLSSAVEQLVTGEDWLRALTFAAKFRARSFNNTLLIAMQHAIAHAEGLVPNPDPTYVAGFKQWKALDRSVRKGQPGYQIYAPVTKRMATFSPETGPWRRLGRGEKPEPGEVVRPRLVGLRPAYVWDVSQTDGKPLPEPPPSVQMPAGEAPTGLWDGLAALVAVRGYDLRIGPDPTALGGALGRTTYPTKRVEICGSLDDAAKTAVLTHDMLTAPSRVSTCGYAAGVRGRHAGGQRGSSCRGCRVLGSAPRRGGGSSNGRGRGVRVARCDHAGCRCSRAGRGAGRRPVADSAAGRGR